MLPLIASDPGACLSVAGLDRSYGGRRAVRAATFRLTPGVTGLLGPNGAGKSSLLGCLAGIATWERGTVRIGDVDLAAHPREGRRRIGFMPERVAFPAEMRVVEYLHYVASVKGVPRHRRPDVVDVALRRCGLVDVQRRVIANLSKGYRQRVGLAQALLGDPPVVILDEPMAGLDPLNVFEMRAVLQEYAADRVVLVSTHDLPDARLMCDRVIVMAAGTIVYDGAPSGMGNDRDGSVRVRVRLRGEGTLVVPDGFRLVHCHTATAETVILVDAPDDVSVGTLVRRLSDDWSVLGVERTMDSLEEAFRNAVLGIDTESEEG